MACKELTVGNWLEMDPVMRSWALLNRETGESRTKQAEDWLEEILQPDLPSVVPKEVREQFEVARGAMAYGYFFYPLYTLGDAQLFRVADSAVYHRWVASGSPPPGGDFAKRLDRLREVGVLSEEDASRWASVRHLRNSASHETQQSIVMPVDALRSLIGLSEMIGELFVRA